MADGSRDGYGIHGLLTGTTAGPRWPDLMNSRLRSDVSLSTGAWRRK